MKEPLSRRDFCAACGALFAALHLPGCGGFGSPAAVLPPPDATALPDLATPDLTPPEDLTHLRDFAVCNGSINFGLAGDVTVHSAAMMSGVTLCRDANGLYAMSAICTHNGCTLEFQPDKPLFYCGCHSSRFDYQGQLINGPAPTPLRHFAACIARSGEILVDPTTVVDPSKRV